MNRQLLIIERIFKGLWEFANPALRLVAESLWVSWDVFFVLWEHSTVPLLS